MVTFTFSTETTISISFKGLSKLLFLQKDAVCGFGVRAKEECDFI
jgi:hypothetical protein